MALRFIESCEHATYPVQKWGCTRRSFQSGQSVGQYTYGFGRHGNACINIGQTRNVVVTLDYQQTWILGGAWYFSSHGADGIYTILNGGIQGNVQIRLFFSQTAQVLYVYRGGTGWSGTLLASYQIPNFRASTWYFIELKAKIATGTDGYVTVRLNGQTVIDEQGINTSADGYAYANAFCYGSDWDGTPGSYTDDIYICDGATGAGSNPCNDFLGDVRVDTIMPSGNGNSSQFVGSDANSTDNYLLVDEAQPNGDTDYVESATVGDKDTYAFDNLASAQGTVFGVQVLPYVRKTDAGSRSICSVARLSTTEVDSADKVLADSYLYIPDIRETKPGGGDWTITDINNAEFGIKVTA